MSSIKFLGAAGTVTGSSYIFTPSLGKPVLIDLGMFQGPEEISKLNYEQLELDATTLEALILTHAHLDHCGRLPLLVQKGFTGKTYMTAATRELAELVLVDSAKIAERDEDKVPLYSQQDVEGVLSLAEIVAYDQEFSIGNLRVVLREAGHILGSASIEITDGDKRIVFSGDLGNTPEDIVRPTHMVDAADIVLMESTYGDRLHPSHDAAAILQSEINTVEQSGGALLLPTFSLERTQVILHMLDHLKKDRKIKEETPVFLDGPMGIAATEIYRRFKNLYNKEMSRHANIDDPFDFPGLVITDKPKQSKRIKHAPGPKVIIAGSGMMTGGRITGHAAHFLPVENTRLLIIGYQGEGTLGRELHEGATEVTIYNKKVLVRATVSEISSLSAHADQSQLLSWLQNIQGVQKLFLTHGEDGPRKTLAEKITKDLGITDIVLPQLNEKVELD